MVFGAGGFGTGGGPQSRNVSTYTITRDGATYTAIKSEDGSTVSSGPVLETVFDAVLVDKGVSTPASIEFGAGNFVATGTLNLISHENYHIKGQGIGITVVQLNAGNVDVSLFSGRRPSANTSHGLNAVARGDTTVTITSGSDEGLVADDWIRVFSTDIIDGATATHVNGEIHQIKSITAGGVITLYSGIITSLWTAPEVVQMAMKNNISYSDMTIEDIRVGVTNQALSSGILEAFVVGLTITNVEFRGCWWGALGISANFDTRVIGCKFYNTQLDSVAYDIFVASSQNTTLTANNHFIDWHGVSIISGGDASGSGDARSGRCINTIISSCTFQGTFVHSIDTHDGALDVNIIGNTITSSLVPASDNAILVRSPTNIIGNVIVGGFAACVFIGNDGKPTNGNACNIMGNHMEGQIKYGIRCNAGVENQNIDGNYIKGADFVGIEFERTDAAERSGEASRIVNNYIHGESLRTGVGIQADSVIDFVANDNYVRECITGVRVGDVDGRTDYVFVNYNHFDDCTINVTIVGANANGNSTDGNRTMS